MMPSCGKRRNPKVSAFRILPQIRQRGEGSFNRIGQSRVINHRVGVAGEVRQREGEFLRDGLADIDRITGQWLKGGFVSVECNLLLFLWVRAIEQREAVGNCTTNRFEGDRAALVELCLKYRFQQDDLPTLPPELNVGDEAVECKKVETFGEFFPLLRRGLDSLPERCGPQPHERNKAGELRCNGAHRDLADKRSTVPRRRFGGAPNKIRP